VELEWSCSGIILGFLWMKIGFIGVIFLYIFIFFVLCLFCDYPLPFGKRTEVKIAPEEKN
jgi:hypothetical protein